MRRGILHTVDNSNFEDEIDSKELSMVMFTSGMCSHCSEVEMTLSKMKNAGTPVYFINHAEHQDLVLKYSVKAIPTVVVFRNGRIDAHLAGKYPKEKYLSFL